MSRWLDAALKPSDKKDKSREIAQAIEPAGVSFGTKPPETPDRSRTEVDKSPAPGAPLGQKRLLSDFCPEAKTAPSPYKQEGSGLLSHLSFLSQGVEGDGGDEAPGRADPPTPEAAAPSPVAEVVPLPVRPDPDPLPDPTRAGRVRTWTGLVVSIEAWRHLSAWDRHGPNGRHWDGRTASWEWPEGGGAA